MIESNYDDGSTRRISPSSHTQRWENRYNYERRQCEDHHNQHNSNSNFQETFAKKSLFLNDQSLDKNGSFQYQKTRPTIRAFEYAQDLNT